jgi:membrane fusion protein, multidrug efflux system
MKPSKSLLVARTLALSAFAALALAACGKQAVPQASPQAASPPVSAATIIQRQITETQEFSGRVEAVDRVDIRPRVGGFIAAVNIKPGGEVKKGDLLFVIDPRPYQAEANRTQAAALAARAKADLAKLELTRAQKLVVDKAIAQREADEKAANYKELEAATHAAQAAYDAARLNLDYTRVVSPINGRVSKAEVTLGNLVDSSVVLTSVVSANPIYASFEGDEDTYLRVRRQAHDGKSVAVHIGLANESGFPHEGRLEFVDNRVDTGTGSVRMRALLKNDDNLLAPGLFARVQLDVGDRSGRPSQALLVADRAIGTDQSNKFVYVVTADGKAEYRAVKLGPVVDDLHIVREGLNPGERIVVDGLQRVKAGMPVTAQMVPMENGARQATVATEGGKPPKKS